LKTVNISEFASVLFNKYSYFKAFSYVFESPLLVSLALLRTGALPFSFWSLAEVWTAER
jgi:hypothetical protein